MYKKVVVPLDGSKIAELALPHLEVIGKGCSIPDVLLISVTEKISGIVSQGGANDQFIPERPVDKKMPAVETSQWGIVFSTYAAGVQKVPMTLGKMARTAADYLCKIAKDLEKKGFNVVATVLVGNPAEQIIRYVTEQSADLVIMASTGKSGLSRWNMSNITNRVIKESCAPVLVVKPGPDFKETKPKRKGVAF
ncbi:MAG: universal stress protein [Dehalococcoidales bacterium]|nr:universal stress protein [Dehalococcoidales bacterium]